MLDYGSKTLFCVGDIASDFKETVNLIDVGSRITMVRVVKICFSAFFVNSGGILWEEGIV